MVVTPPGEPAELLPESETRFFLKVREDTQVTFVRDDTGAVTHLILHQGFRGDLHAKKAK